jgi:Protein of unknown function (DUF2510)
LVHTFGGGPERRGSERSGSVPPGVISLQTRFLAMAFLLLFCRTRVELDGQRYKLPWGQLRVPVVPGWHQLRVWVRYLWLDIGVATKDFDVRGGHIVELSYRAPWLIVLRGKLRSIGDRPLLAQEIPSGLASSVPPWDSMPGWHSDPSDGQQRRWWDGERWTSGIFRPQSRARKAWVVAVSAVALIVALSVASAIASDSDDSAAPAQSAQWVTVTEIDGVRLDMPIQPEHSTERIPGTDLTVDMYSVYYDNMVMSAVAEANPRPPGDNRTDKMILHDVRDAAADNIDGKIVFTRDAVVDGKPGLDFEVTTPQDGGTTVLARAALNGDLLVLVETAFNHDDLAVAAESHNRMARSIRFEA